MIKLHGLEIFSKQENAQVEDEHLPRTRRKKESATTATFSRQYIRTYIRSGGIAGRGPSLT